MPTVDEVPQEDDVPELAVQALQAAQRRSEQAGHPQVVVRDGQLLRITATVTEVLKTMPARGKVAVRQKHADS